MHSYPLCYNGIYSDIYHSGKYLFFSKNLSFHLGSFPFRLKNFLSIFYIASALATSSLGFLTLDGVLFAFLNDLFTGYRILSWQLFFFHTLKILSHSLQHSTVPNQKWSVNWLLSFPMYYAIFLLVLITGFQYFWW